MEFPHSITINMSDAMFKGLQTEVRLRHMTGQFVPKVSTQDLFLLVLLKSMEDGKEEIHIRTLKEGNDARTGNDQEDQ